jgi:hypothetical protein
MDNRGSMLYNILFTLIVGLIVVGISFAFIFRESWNGDDTDREVCWQSVQARAMIPDTEIAGFLRVGVEDFTGEYPLKCKTRVFEITKEDVVEIDRAYDIIGDAMADCWALYGNGDLNAFPSDLFGGTSSCVACGRIHLSNEAKEYMASQDPPLKISLVNSLDSPMTDDFTYGSYINNSGEHFSAFDFATANSFDFMNDIFEIDDSAKEPAILVDRLTGKTDSHVIFGYSMADINKVRLPEFMYYDKGDLMINYGVVVTAKEGEIGNYIPYLFYYQTFQEDNPILETHEIFVNGPAGYNIDFCENWEGIPG